MLQNKHLHHEGPDCSRERKFLQGPLARSRALNLQLAQRGSLDVVHTLSKAILLLDGLARNDTYWGVPWTAMRQSWDLPEAILALSMAAPWVLAKQFAEPQHCIELSCCGAAVLRAKGFDADPIACCCYLVTDGGQGFVAPLGAPLGDLEAHPGLRPQDGLEVPSSGSSTHQPPVHYIVEARHPQDQDQESKPVGIITRIDLTAIQFNVLCGKRCRVPTTIRWTHQQHQADWPQFRFPGGKLY
jgi:hypothetical protein